ncbi:MAG: DUF3417 domain-containing protein [Sulfuricaulis sp.]
MTEQARISHPKQRVLSRGIEGFDTLTELALDMHSAWNHAANQVWRQLDPVLWELTHNPWVVLQTVSREKFQQVSADTAFRIPAASAYLERAAGTGKTGAQVVNWRHALAQNWTAPRFGETKAVTSAGQHVFDVQVYLGDLDPKALRIELYADAVSDGAPARQTMQRVRQLAGASGGYVYQAVVSATRPVADYTARVIPCFDGVSVPLEEPRILWQR